MAKDINIGGRLHSIATGNVIAGADEILDDNLGKKQTQINTETYTLVESVNNALDALNPDQQEALAVAAKANANEAKLGYYVCDTDAAVAAKTITATGYVLTTGGNIRIKMTNANTADAVTLNINNTGAKALFYNGTQASSTNSWEAGEVVEVYYDGTQFQCQANKGGEDAKNIAYNNTNSNLNADNVQDAIDEFVVDRSETVNLIDCIPNTGLKQDGTTVSASSFYTSDFINVSNATKIYTNSLHRSEKVYTGIVFYTQSKQVIFTPFVAGDIPNTIDMTNFKDASYIRVCGSSGASISIDKKAVIQPIQYPETIERVVNIQKEYTKTDAIYTGNVLYASGGIGTGASKYSVTPFIKISGATRIITNALWSSGGGFAGLVLYAADSHTVIRCINGTSDVDITGENAFYMRVMFSDNQNEKVVVVTNTTACYISAESVLYGESNVGNEIDKLNEKVNSPTDAVYTIEDTESSGILKEDGTITIYGSWKYKRINIPEFCNLIKFSGLYGIGYGYSGGGIFDKNNNLISHLNKSGVIDLKCYPNASYVIFCADTGYTPNATLILSNKEDNELYVYNYYGVKCRLGEDIDNNIIFKTTQYKNVVVLGNSLTWHEYYPSLGWYGTNRSMASTTASVSWTNQLQKILQKKESGAIVTGVMTRAWERAGDGNRNHNRIKQLLDDALTNDVDLIIFRTGENAKIGNINVFETEIKELLDYCLSIAKKAEVLITSCFWEDNNKDTAIKNVAEERHYMFISTGSRFSYHKELIGDFMVDDTDNVEKMLTNKDVTAHTNDVGFYMFTDYLASYLGYGDLLLNEMFDISVDSTLTNGYKIKELKAQRDALVTVLTYESNQPTISVVDENENAIPTNVHDITGTSTYTYAFTFIMPQSNVNITLS